MFSCCLIFKQNNLRRLSKRGWRRWFYHHLRPTHFPLLGNTAEVRQTLAEVAEVMKKLPRVDKKPAKNK